ncbi:Probable ribonuclease FitB [Legionella beliardensis]|uniref:Probable ribonuclease FitB n=1 Tax=Legionella beliardensis TaxID=91822 RepID=A0A378HYW2_9GAMM|nr:type II toxin-antitoxin system VapC family toxin [Legionella beliardensis]STX27913.1 Probable ribonuclease FitB [Legionella beliardensis]
MFLLDTNVVSELRKANSNKVNHNLVHWAKKTNISLMFISVISLLELEMGILKKEKKDPLQGSTLRAWFDSHVLPAFAARIVPIDIAVTRTMAKLHVPKSCSRRNVMIAASALIHGMTLVTRNKVDFAKTGVDIIDPWESDEE